MKLPSETDLEKVTEASGELDGRVFRVYKPDLPAIAE
jgi:hypothetical protein